MADAAMPFGRIAILGLGLMGGSVALTLRANGYAGALWGAGGSDADLAAARRSRAVSVQQSPIDASPEPQAENSRATFTTVYSDPSALPWTQLDLLVLAVPPAAVRDWLPRVAAQAGDFVVTDLASVKGDLCTLGQELLGGRYLSSHPLVGAERHGFSAANDHLYASSRCLLTPLGDVHPAQAALTAFWQFLGCEVGLLPPAEHDVALALTSHIPHVLAFAFLAGLPLDGELPLTSLGGGGLRDFSRIAGSDPALWADILCANAAAVDAGLARFQADLMGIQALLRQGDRAALAAVLAQGRQHRQQFQFPPA